MTWTCSRPAVPFLSVILLCGPSVGTPLPAEAASAREQTPVADAGRLHLSVRDALDGLLPGATITVHGPSGTPQEQVAVTDERGEARIDGLAPGQYRVEVSMPGFEPDAFDVAVARGRATQRVAKLALSGYSEQVTVVENTAPAQNTDGFAESLTAGEIDQLPDDADELAELLQQMAGGDAEFRVNGFEGGDLPPRAQIQAIRIRQDPFSPDSQGAGTPRVEIITRPGSAAWTHEINAGFRDQSLDARHAFAEARAQGQTRRASWSISGPLVRNRTSLSARISTNNLFEAQTIVATGVGGAFGDLVNQERGRFDAEARVEHALTGTHTLRFEYQRRQFTGDNLGVGDFDLPERAYAEDRERHVVRLSERGAIGRRIFNELRVEYVDDLQRTESRSYDRTVDVQNAFTAGGAQRQGGVREQEIEIANELEFVRNDRHTLRLGFEGEFGRSRSDRRENAAGTFVFAGLDDYAAGRPLQFVQRVGNPLVEYSRYEMSWWVQDERKVSDRLRLSLGLRHDFQGFLDDRANVAPRVSAAWTPFAHGRTTVTAGVGLFNGWYNAGVYEQTLRLDGERQRDLIVRNPGFPDPFASGGEAETPPASVIRAAGDLDMQSTRRASIGVEHRLTDRIRLRLNVFDQSTRNRLRSLNVNAPIDGERPEPDFQRITEIRSTGEADSRGLDASLRVGGGSRGRGASGFVRYRYARGWNDADGPLSLPADSTDLGAEWGPASNDIRHRIFGSLQMPLAFGLRASLSANVQSGAPYTIRTGFDDNGDTVTNDRPEGAGRNSARGSWRRTVDLRLGWRPWLMERTPGSDGGRSTPRGLELYARVTNLLNETNYTRFTGVMTSPFFGQPTAAAAPRRFDVGARLFF